VARNCSIWAHDEAHAINVELVSRVPYRDIERRFGVGRNALKRHLEEHIPELLVKAKEDLEAFEASENFRQIKALQAKTLKLLLDAEEAGELRTALAGIREARGNLQQQSKPLIRRRSWTRLPVVFSSIAGTAPRFNSYDERCRRA
jgi:hypothetical protein